MRKMIFFILLSLQIFPKEFAFLPTYVIGRAPSFISQKDNPTEGVSDLLAFYAKEQYEMELTDSDTLRNYLESLEEDTNRKPSRYLINGICSELEPDFLVHNEVDFEGRGNIVSEVYNCKGKVLYRKESFLEENFYTSIENHSKTLFSFLNPKPKPNLDSPSDEEITIVLDTSGSMSTDAREVLNYIEETAGLKKIGILILKKTSYSYLKPTLNTEKIFSFIKNIRFSGEINLEEIGSMTLRASHELAYSSFTKKKLLLLSDARIGKGDAYKFITAMQTMARLGYEVHILTGSYFDHKDVSIYAKAANSAGGKLYPVTHLQVIGTPEGYKTLFLRDRKIYYVNEKFVNVGKFDPESAFKISESQIYSEVDFPHPGNMAEVFLKVTKQKAIEYGKVTSNVREIVDKIIQADSSSLLQTYSKVLLKTGTTSIWLKVKNASESWIGTEAVFKVTLKKDKYSPLGFSNIPEKSFYYKESFPLLLVLSNSEIQTLLEKAPSHTIDCFFRGKVLEVKQ